VEMLRRVQQASSGRGGPTVGRVTGLGGVEQKRPFFTSRAVMMK